MRFSEHCLERFRCHNPDAEVEDLERAWAASSTLMTELALSLMGRRLPRRTSPNAYHASPDGRGIFVRDGTTIITYIRLCEKATQILTGNVPEEKEPPATPPKNNRYPGDKRKAMARYIQELVGGPPFCQLKRSPNAPTFPVIFAHRSNIKLDGEPFQIEGQNYVVFQEEQYVYRLRPEW